MSDVSNTDVYLYSLWAGSIFRQIAGFRFPNACHKIWVYGASLMRNRDHIIRHTRTYTHTHTHTHTFMRIKYTADSGQCGNNTGIMYQVTATCIQMIHKETLVHYRHD
jgi:hypothetical protein